MLNVQRKLSKSGNIQSDFILSTIHRLSIKILIKIEFGFYQSL